MGYSHGARARYEAQSLLLDFPYPLVVDRALPGWKTTFGVEICSDLHDVGTGQLSILEHRIVEQILGNLLLVPTFAHDNKAMGSPIMARRKPG